MAIRQQPKQKKKIMFRVILVADIGFAIPGTHMHKTRVKPEWKWPRYSFSSCAAPLVRHHTVFHCFIHMRIFHHFVSSCAARWLSHWENKNTHTVTAMAGQAVSSHCVGIRFSVSKTNSEMSTASVTRNVFYTFRYSMRIAEAPTMNQKNI